MGTPTAAFETAVAAKVRALVGSGTMKNWTANRDKNVDSEVTSVTEAVVADASQEVASALGDLSETDYKAIGLTARLVIVRFTGEYSGTLSNEQQASEARVVGAIEQERLRRIHSTASPLVRESVYRPRPDYSKEHPTNTKFNG